MQSAYAGASSSVIPTAWAAIGKSRDLGIDYWLAGSRVLEQKNVGMSQLALGGIKNFTPPKAELLAPDKPEYFVAVSAVITETAASETQTEKARRLGRKLLVSAAKQDRTWVDDNLKSVLFSTRHSHRELQINDNNFDEIAYASSRMLHAWDIPAWIDGKPFVDASYTCLCPAMEMVDAGYKEIIAIFNEPGMLYRDMFQIEEIPGSHDGANIHTIQPDINLVDLGVNFTDASSEGLIAAYQHGEEKGKDFLQNNIRI